MRDTRPASELDDSAATGSDRTSVVVALIVAIAVVIASTLVVKSGKVSGLEADVFHAINDRPDSLERVMWVFQLAGLLLVPLVVAIGAAIYRKWWLTLCLVLIVPLKLFFEKEVMKNLVTRERPGTSICDGDATCGHFRDVPLRGESYVSGHAVVAWCVATLLFFYLGRTGRIVVIAIAVANSIARVYLGAHNPLDVVGGGALGVAIGCALLLVIDPLRRDARGRNRKGSTRPHPEVGEAV